MTKITVLIAQDHFVVRESLRALLNNEPDMEVVGAAETGHQAVEMARRFRPAVVVMDISMPALNGLEATQQIRRALPGTHVLILSAHSDKDCAAKMIRLGAGGFLPKSTAGDLLARAIREIHKGNTVFGHPAPNDTGGLVEKRSKSRVPRQRALDSPWAPLRFR